MSNREVLDIIKDNIIAILAILWSLFAFSIILIILVNWAKDENIVTLIATGIFGIANLIVGFYFGSSQGSKDKTKALTERH